MRESGGAASPERLLDATVSAWDEAARGSIENDDNAGNGGNQRARQQPSHQNSRSSCSTIFLAGVVAGFSADGQTGLLLFDRHLVEGLVAGRVRGVIGQLIGGTELVAD